MEKVEISYRVTWRTSRNNYFLTNSQKTWRNCKKRLDSPGELSEKNI